MEPPAALDRFGPSIKLSMKIYRAIPRLEKKRFLNLWHRAQEAQWSALEVDWKAPQRIVSKVNKDRMARILTPVLMAERSAFHSAMALLPFLGQNDEIESQYYLSTWLVDEARHAELFALMFDRLDREPISPRRLPAAYLFQSRILSEDRAVWFAGLLVAEVMAKHVMKEFRRLDLDPVLSEISDRILVDEARHLGFNRIYIEDQVAQIGREDAEKAVAYGDRLVAWLESVLESVPVALGSIGKELREIEFDFDTVIDCLAEESRSRLERAIRAGHRAAATAPSEGRVQHAEDRGL